MKTALAWHNLTYNKVRTGAAIAGVMFAVVLLFVQLGFLAATKEGASLVYDSLDFDLLLRSPRSRRLSESQPFPRSRLDLAASVARVQEVHPFYIGFQRWRIPRGPDEGYGRRILLMGVNPVDPVLVREEMRAKASLLTQPEFALIDRLARKEFGPRNGRRFDEEDIGSEVEIGYRRVKIIGLYTLGASVDADASLLLSDEGFRRLYSGWNPGMVSLGLVKLQDPRTDAEAVVRQMTRVLPADVEVWTKSAIIAHERYMWLWDMSIGVILFLGVVVALLVGAAIVYQILSSDVASHLPEYATLKAMGYTNGFLGKVVLQQALILGLCGFLPGLVVAHGLYALTRAATNIPIYMSLLRVVGVLGLSIAMCAVSGMAALRKLRAADPADLFV